MKNKEKIIKIIINLFLFIFNFSVIIALYPGDGILENYINFNIIEKLLTPFNKLINYFDKLFNWDLSGLIIVCILYVINFSLLSIKINQNKKSIVKLFYILLFAITILYFCYLLLGFYIFSGEGPYQNFNL